MILFMRPTPMTWWFCPLAKVRDEAEEVWGGHGGAWEGIAQ